jgi:hypothetical protein
VEGAVTGEVNPATVNPITELLKLPVIFSVLGVREVQVAVKSRNALQLRLLTIK